MKKTTKLSMKKKAMKTSKIARGKRAKSSVFNGRKEKTVGGLKKADLIKNKFGKVVSKKSSEHGQNIWKKHKHLSKWLTASKQARKALNIKGYCLVGGKTEQGQALLEKTRELYKK